MANAEEDWSDDCKKSSAAGTRSSKMVEREKKGMPTEGPKPEGIDVIGFSVFFDSLFELADGWLAPLGVHCVLCGTCLSFVVYLCAIACVTYASCVCCVP